MAAQAEEVLHSLLRAHLQGMPPCPLSLSSLLQNLAAVADVASARSAHSLIISSSLQSTPLLGDHLIRLFTTCGTLVEACLAFSQSSDPSTYTWQAIISCHITHGKHTAALALYRDMHIQGIMPNKFIYPCVLQACGGACVPEQGFLVHDHILRSAVDSVVVVGNTLIDMYIKCASVKDAKKVFDDMRHKDVVSWGSIISGYSQHGDGLAALYLFKQMQEEGITPNRVAFLCTLKACASILALADGRLMHEQIIRAHFEGDVLVGNTITDMYAKCGSLEDAQKVLWGLKSRTVSSWNAMIGGYAQYGAVEPALDLFHNMSMEGTTPDTVTYACVLTACGSKGDLEQGKFLHELIAKTGLESNEFVGNSLIDMYAKCGSLEEARNVFDNLPTQNSVSWGAMFAGYAQHEYGFHALELFEKMLQLSIRPDEIVLSCILKACSSIEGLHFGKMIHNYLVSRGLEIDLIVSNTLVDMYAKLGSLEDAHRVFDRLTSPNVVSWGAILAGYAQHDQGQPAFDFFRNMLVKGVKPDNAAFSCVAKACGSNGLLEQGRWVHEQIFRSGLPFDVAVGNALIEMYAKCEFVEDARNVFDTMMLRDVVSWNLMFTAYAQAGQALLVLGLFEKMQRDGMQPNQVSFLVLLQVCGSLGALAQVKQVHNQIYEAGLGSDLVLANSLIDTYGKCGSIEDSGKVFDSMLKRDEVSWGAIIAGHTQHGNHGLVLQCFEAMRRQGVKPNSMIYTSVLSACSHIGQVEEGRRHFRSMKDFCIAPTVEHFNCMIDLLGRAGFLMEAKHLLESMPVSPDILGWMSLLNSCKAYAETEMGKECLDQIVLLNKDISGGYVLMSNLYAETDKWEEVERLIGLRQSTSWKKPGAARIEIDNQVQEFMVGDKTHPQSEIISNLLKRHKKLMDFKGYIPILNLSLELVSKNVKEDVNLI
eukprot:c20365_g1_i1 orf=442-3237(-)